MYFQIIKRSLAYNLNIFKETKRVFSISKIFRQKKESEDEFLEDTSYYDSFKEVPLRSTGQNVLAIQPNMKHIVQREKVTNAELQLAELCALAESIPGWKVAEHCIHSLKMVDKQTVFGKGKLEELADEVRRLKRDISAVVLGIDTLNSNQLEYLQDLWKLPVYDRYTLVLEIFRSRATTSEAKLQVSMAEIHYLRKHLKGMHSDSLDYQKEGLQFAGGMQERTFLTRKTMLNERENKLKKCLEKVGNHRMLVRKNRKEQEIPIVAIVGYTNAGKTSLIKSLTGLSKLAPKNELFATLDITNFPGLLPNNTKVLYMDTVGFISDIPKSLIESFHVTLEDVSNADLLVHVSDASNPDRIAQDIVVEETLSKLPSMPQSLLDNMIRVYNKVDLVDENEVSHLTENDETNRFLMSVKEGLGRQEVMERIQESIMKITGRVTKMLRIPAGGSMLRWLYKEATVEEVIPDENDPQMYLVKVTMAPSDLGRFNAKYRMKKK